MAANDTPDFDDLEPVEINEQEDDSDAEWLDLEPGESVVGEVRAVRPNCGQYDNTVIELARGLGDVVVMWSNGQIDRAFRVNDIGEGDVVGIKHTEDTATAENEDGEEYEFDIWEVRALGGDD
ncbi:hypothetical protein SAMN05216559_0130 [Halomicrobium zhouii]|uniref:Uncharacterized protein n=1 Tax=Halomicrobium zhouii TaxID=767519 RepID=A0A1I6K3G9_9EURY|nr:hypothetical protein [Halomicrobium zhouii]SFR85737.1 hypothetical protein SAMN05216559_0130 [Halomicrobium zhouii]